MKDVSLRAEELTEAIRRLGQRDRLQLETWVSIGLAFTLMIVGSVIFWRLQVALQAASKELGPSVATRIQDLFSGTLFPFLALSVGSFLILVVTVLAMRWTRLRLEFERRRSMVSDLVMRLVGQYQDEYLGRISSWLHDGIGHGLVMQKMDIEYLKQKGLIAEADGARLIVQLKELIEQTRSMAGMIYPNTLFQFGFRAALITLIENFVRMSRHEVEQELGEIDGACSEEVAFLVFRIVQEALTNVAKHARATRIEVKVFCHDGRLIGSVSNDGLPYDASVKPMGIGLMVISERTKRLGGEVTVGVGDRWPYQLSFAFPARSGA